METQEKQILINQLYELVKPMMSKLPHYIIETKSKNINDILKSFNENGIINNRGIFKLITGEEAELFEIAVEINLLNTYKVNDVIDKLWYEYDYIESHKHDEDYNQMVKCFKKRWGWVD